jgi:hypothetical protein
MLFATKEKLTFYRHYEEQITGIYFAKKRFVDIFE